MLYRNQIQLATPDAFYSDGTRYPPARAIVKTLKKFFSTASTTLVLGTGIGSFVRVMHANGFKPAYDLVEIDEVVLAMAMELLSEFKDIQLNPLCIDAAQFLERCNKTYDFIFIDIFNGRVTPDFVSSEQFLSSCKKHLTNNGAVAFNYIVNDKELWNQTVVQFSAVFPNNKIVDLGINKALIGMK